MLYQKKKSHLLILFSKKTPGLFKETICLFNTEGKKPKVLI